jgi:hypothetical protein
MAQQGAPPRPPSTDETIHGKVDSLPSHYAMLFRDDRGFTDNVTLRDQTVLNPADLRLDSGVPLTIIGHPDGRTFVADEIDGPPGDASDRSDTAPPPDASGPPDTSYDAPPDDGAYVAPVDPGYDVGYVAPAPYPVVIGGFGFYGGYGYYGGYPYGGYYYGGPRYGGYPGGRTYAPPAGYGSPGYVPGPYRRAPGSPSTSAVTGGSRYAAPSTSRASAQSSSGSHGSHH